MGWCLADDSGHRFVSVLSDHKNVKLGKGEKQDNSVELMFPLICLNFRVELRRILACFHFVEVQLLLPKVEVVTNMRLQG